MEGISSWLTSLSTHESFGARMALRANQPVTIAGMTMARTSDVRRRIEGLQTRVYDHDSNLPRAGVLLGCLCLLVMTVFSGVALKSSVASPPDSQPAKPAAKQDGKRVAATAEQPLAPNPVKLANGRMEIVALDRRTKQPLKGVQLRFHGWITQRIDRKIKTDEDGLAQIEWKANAVIRNLWMTASLSGHVPIHHTWRSEQKKIELPARLELLFDEGTETGGIVVDESGKPIEGASVSLSMPITWPKLANYVFTPASFTTGQDGRWTWDSAPVDIRISMRVSHPDYLRAGESVKVTGENRVVLKQGIFVRGTVLDPDGKPVEGAIAQLGFDRFGTGQPDALTDEKGQFVLKNCKAGASAITIQAPKLCPMAQRITVSDDLKPLVFRLEPGHVLHGRVVDSAGKPIPGVLVAPDTWRGFRTLKNRMNTDAAGRFRWAGAPPDGIKFSILKTGYMGHRDTVLKASEDEVTVTMNPLLRISGQVTDAKTGKPIPEFRIANGYKFASSDHLYWDRDEPDKFRDGKYLIKFDEPSRARLLKVTAAGYLPKESRAFKTDEGHQTYHFKLERGHGPAGVVLLPDGKPANGADVGWATRTRRASLRHGKFDRGQNAAEVVKTDEKGRFQFVPQETDDAVLIAVHDSGFAEMTRSEFEKAKLLQLKPWGRLMGRVRLGNKADADRMVKFYPKRTGSGLFVWDYNYETKTDSRGFFRFEKVIPGPGVVSRVTVTAFLDSWQYASGWQVPVVVGDRQALKVTIGGNGRPVIGKAVLDREPELPINWTTNEPVRITRWDRTNKRAASPNFTCLANVEKDGSFRIPDVPPGQYRLSLPANNPPVPNACGAGQAIGRATVIFDVPAKPETSTAPFDVGTVTVKLSDTLNVGDVAPEFVLADLQGGPVKLSDFDGKLVLLDFWATWCGPCRAEMPTLLGIHKKYRDDPRFVLLSVSLDESAEAPLDFVNKHKFDWRHAHSRGTQSKVARDFTVRALPGTFLIAPDGTVLSKNLRGKQLAADVDAALNNKALFSATSKRGPRFPIQRFETDVARTSLPEKPGLLVLENVTRGAGKVPAPSRLRLFAESGKELWSHAGVKSYGSVGGVHGLALDAKRNRIYLRENGEGRVTALDTSGQRLWQVSKMNAGAISVDEATGNLWCAVGLQLNQGETVVLDSQGSEVASWPIRAIDIAYDPHSDAFWMAGYHQTKIDRTGKVLMNRKVDGWCCVSVSVNRKDGTAWMVERNHPDIDGKNRLWAFNSDGAVLHKIDLNENNPMQVVCLSHSGTAWVLCRQGVLRVDPNGKVGPLMNFASRGVSANSTGDRLWMGLESKVLRLNDSGKSVGEFSLDRPLKSGLLLAF